MESGARGIALGGMQIGRMVEVFRFCVRFKLFFYYMK